MKLKVSSSKSEEKKEGPLKNKDLGDDDAPVLTIHSVLTKDYSKKEEISPKKDSVHRAGNGFYTRNIYYFTTTIQIPHHPHLIHDYHNPPTTQTTIP